MSTTAQADSQATTVPALTEAERIAAHAAKRAADDEAQARHTREQFMLPDLRDADQQVAEAALTLAYWLGRRRQRHRAWAVEQYDPTNILRAMDSHHYRADKATAPMVALIRQVIADLKAVE